MCIMLLCQVSRAPAATESGDLIVDVRAASSGAPVPLARILLQADVSSVGYTGDDGKATFEALAPGSYRVAASKRGFLPQQSPLFEIRANITTTISIVLSAQGSLKQIGSVRISQSPLRIANSVGQSDSLRALDGSLRDAIGDLPGLTSSSAGLSIEGAPESLTGTSIDGLNIPGVGGQLANRGINDDLFASASASADPSSGSVGGQVNFHTYQPTLAPQEQATFEYGSDNSSNALFMARGSAGALGYVAEHAVRGTVGDLTGLTFPDRSGLTYLHDGDDFSEGDLGKLRWSPSLSQTLTLTATSSNDRRALACDYDVALLPCGYGPGMFADQHTSLASLSESAVIGMTTLSAAAYVAGNRFDDDESTRLFAGEPAPEAQRLESLTRGAQLQALLPAFGKHEFSLNAAEYGLTVTATSLSSLGPFSGTSSDAYRALSIGDQYRPNGALTVTQSAGYEGSSGVSGFSASVQGRWQPASSVAYNLEADTGSLGASISQPLSAIPAPTDLIYDCAEHQVVGQVQTSSSNAQRSDGVRSSIEHAGKRGRLLATAWSRSIEGSPAQVVLGASDLPLPPGYGFTVDSLWQSPFVCGGGAPPPNLLFTSTVPANEVNRGALLAGALQIGGATTLSAFASVQSTYIAGGVSASESLAPFGAQLPGIPLHRAAVVLTSKVTPAIDVLADANYVFGGNAYGLGQYTLVNAGVAFPLGIGSLAVVGRNLTNRYAGTFVGLSDFEALPRYEASPLFLPGTLLRPRSVDVTYTVRLGRLSGGSGASTTTATDEVAQQSQDVAVVLHTFPASPPSHPLAIDPTNDACTPASARALEPILAAVQNMADAAERATSSGVYPAESREGSRRVGLAMLRYEPYDGGRRFIVSIDADVHLIPALFQCMRISSGDAQAAAAHGLAVLGRAPVGRFYLAYGPSVGLYLTVGGSQGAEQVQTDPVPSAPPKEPLKLRDDCPAQSRPIALVAADVLRRATVGGVLTSAEGDGVAVTAHAGASGGWLDVNLPDAFASTAVLSCLHVAGVPLAQLQAIGYAKPGSAALPLGYTTRYGIFTPLSSAPANGP
jgi:hypothetical protein